MFFFCLIACHILAEGIAPIYTLKNFGLSDNCTLTALYPAVVSVKSISVGRSSEAMSFDVSIKYANVVIIILIDILGTKRYFVVRLLNSEISVH